MSILFTKNISPQIIKKHLGNECIWDIVEVIKTESIPFTTKINKTSALIFTSKNAIESFRKQKIISKNKTYCVGKSTKNRLSDLGFSVEYMAKNAEELSRFLIENKVKSSIHFCGNLTLDILEKNLKNHHLDYQKVEVYKTELKYPKIQKNYTILVFFSPSGVRSFFRNNDFQGKLIFSIGKTTSQAIKLHTGTSAITSAEESLEDLLDLIKIKINNIYNYD